LKLKIAKKVLLKKLIKAENNFIAAITKKTIKKANNKIKKLKGLLKRLNKKMRKTRKSSNGKISKLSQKGKKMRCNIRKLMVTRFELLAKIGNLNKKLSNVKYDPEHMQDIITEKKWRTKRKGLIIKFKKLRKQIIKLRKTF